MGNKNTARRISEGEERISLLQEMPLFGGLKRETLAFLLQQSSVVRVPQGRLYFEEGERDLSIYVIQSGEVAVLKRFQGREYVLRNLHRGDCFGELAMLDLGPRSATVVAARDSSAVEVPPEALATLRERDLEQMTLVFINIAREVSRKLREADNRLFQAKVEARRVGDDYIFQAI